MTSRVAEHVERGAGRRELTLPVASSYSLSELLPRRDPGSGYRVPGEMGSPLATAFDRAFQMVERGYGPLCVANPSAVLTPKWQRVLNHLHRRGFAKAVHLSMPLERGVPLYYFDIASPFLWHRTDGACPELPRYSRGFSEDYDHALSKVVGECLERGSFLYFRMEDMVRGSARSLRSRGIPFVEPRTLGVFAPWQWERRPELRFDDDSVFNWTECRSLVTGERAWLPAQLVYWNYPRGHADVPEPLLRETSSHGGGGFFTLEGALLSGVLECLQRDGFFLHWLNGLSPPRIDVDGIRRPSTLRLIRDAHDVGLDVVFLDITSELGAPTCLCLLTRSDGEPPHVCMGGSCRLDGEAALHDALLEAASVHHILAQTAEPVRLPEDYEPWSDPSFYAHKRLAFWANPEHARHLEFFLRGRSVSVAEFCRGLSASTDPRKNLEIIIDVLRRHGLRAWYVEAENEVLDELGYAAAKVIIPDLVPLYYEERNAPLGLPRLRTAPCVSGLPPTQPFTPWPHPFP